MNITLGIIGALLVVVLRLGLAYRSLKKRVAKSMEILLIGMASKHLGAPACKVMAELSGFELEAD